MDQARVAMGWQVATTTAGAADDDHWRRWQRVVEAGGPEAAHDRVWAPPRVARQDSSLAPVAARHRRYDQPASGASEDRYIVTSADRRFWTFVTRFLASLREVARFDGHIVILDYGLTVAQRRRLVDQGVEVADPRRRAPLVIDRYQSLAAAFVSRPAATVLYFDADIWFAEPFDELWREAALIQGLGAAKDVWECDYYFTCSGEAHHRSIRRLLDAVIRAHGQTLQAGFVAGSSGAWLRFVDLMDTLIDHGVGATRWGMDALALNAYAQCHAERFTLLPITYNAPPAWGIERHEGRFRATRFQHDGLREDADGPIPVKVIHVTSPYRGGRARLDFESFHPETFTIWRQRLGEPEDDA